PVPEFIPLETSLKYPLEGVRGAGTFGAVDPFELTSNHSLTSEDASRSRIGTASFSAWPRVPTSRTRPPRISASASRYGGMVAIRSFALIQSREARRKI